MEKQTTYTNKGSRLWLATMFCVTFLGTILFGSNTVQAQCTTPSGLSITDVSGTAATLNWTTNGTVTRFEVQTRDSLTITWVTASTSISGGLQSYRIGSNVALQPNKTYQARIRAICNNGTTTAYANTGFFRTSGTASCALPTNLSATEISSVGATFNWESSLENVVSYEVRYRILGGSWFSSGILTPQASHAVRRTNLTPNKTYQWLVRGVCSNGDQVSVDGANFATPLESACAAPTGLSISDISNVGATFNWTNAPNTGGYKIFFKAQAATTWGQAASIGGSTTSFRYGQFTTGVTYSWYMTRTCANGDAPSDKYYGPDFVVNGSATCSSLPTGLGVAAIADTGATLTWSGDTTGIAFYEVEVRKVSTNTIVFIDFIKALSVRATAKGSREGILPNNEYSWKMRTWCANRDRQPWVTGANFSANCASPTELSVTDITGRGATLNWNSVPASGFTVRVRDTTLVSNPWVNYSLTSDKVSLRLSTLSLNTVYQWQILDTCLTGAVNPWRDGGYFATNASSFCAEPSSLTVGSITSSSAIFDWASASNVTLYTLAVRNTSSPSNPWTQVNISGGLNTYTNTSLSPGSNYEWRLSNICTNDDENTWVMGGGFSTPCSSPSGLGTSDITGSGATFNWAIDNTSVSKYEVSFKTVAAANWTVLSSSLNKNALSIRANTLLANTDYVWRIRSTCDDNTVNAWIQSSSFTTTSSYACSQPSALDTSEVTTSGATFEWAGNTSVATFDLQYKTVAATNWTSVTGISGALNSRRISTLVGSTQYIWRVRSVCSNGDVSPWVDGFTFFTSSLPFCNSPESLGTANITGYGVDGTWTMDTTNLLRYNISYKLASSGTWGAAVNVAKNATSFRMNTLLPNTAYDWRIRSVCSNGDIQPYVISSFTTNSSFSCDQPSSLDTSLVTSTAATFEWAGNSSVASFQLEYKTVDAVTWTRITGISGDLTSRRVTTLTTGTEYTWRIRSVCSNGDVSPWVDGFNFSTAVEAPCQSPSNLTATELTANGATLAWTMDTTGLFRYNISFKLSSSGTWGAAVNLAKGITSYRLSTLTANTAYDWRIRSVCSNGDIQPYITGAFTTTGTPGCNVPTGLNVTDTTSNGATLNWSIDTTNVRRFDVSFKTSAAATWGTAISIAKTEDSYRLNALISETSYIWRIRTICKNNDVTDWVVAGDFVTPLAYACNSPESLTSTSLTANGASLGWSVDTTGLSRFDLSFKTSASGTWGSTISVAKSVTSYRLSTLVTSTAYDWRIRSVCSNGDTRGYVLSSFSTTGTPGCNVPTDLNITDTTSNGATLNWSIDTTNVRRFDISFKTSAAATWGSAISVAKSATTYRLNALASQTAYVWRIRTICKNNDVTDYIVSAPFTTPLEYACNSPESLSATSITANGATLNWTIDTTGLSRFDVSFKLVSSGTWGSTISVAKSATSHRLSTLASNSAYDWRIRSVCGNGDVRTYVTSSFSTTSVAACNVPTSLNATSISSSGATFGWSIDTTGIRRFDVQFKTSAATNWGTAISVAKTATSYRATGLIANTSYVWRIRTICSNNDATDYVLASAFSTTNAAACQSPTSLNATSITGVGATLGWSIDTTGLRRFDVSFKLASSGTWGAAVSVAKSATTYRLSTLSPNTAYDWRVRSICSNGDVQTYVVSNFTTNSSYACDFPSSLSTSGITNTAVTFNWVGGSNIQFYDIQIKTVAATSWTNVISNLSGAAISRTRTALVAGTTYMWRMRSKCTNSDVNPWVDGTNFTTTGGGRFADNAANWSEGLNLYPNPSKGLVNIAFDVAVEKTMTVKVFNSLGQQVAENSVVPAAQNNSIELNLHHLPAGVYFVKMMDGDNIVTRQLVLER